MSRVLLSSVVTLVTKYTVACVESWLHPLLIHVEFSKSYYDKEGGREGGRGRGRERGKEGEGGRKGKEGEREEGREGGREGGEREGERKGRGRREEGKRGREGGRERGREGGREGEWQSYALSIDSYHHDMILKLVKEVLDEEQRTKLLW